MMLGHDVLTSERTPDIKISEDVSFDTMLLASNTLKGLKKSGFYVPSPIQLHGIPLGKCGFDLILEAKSGTGKTAVFSVIALEKIDLGKGVQTLVLAPTREIAYQICDVIKTIGASFKGLSVEVVMGGMPYSDDVEKFKQNVHIVVGSPGRVQHLIRNKHIDISSVRLLVLDEADKLVEKMFLPAINSIFSELPSQKQIIMSSATYPEGVKTIMNNYLQNAHHICPDSGSVLLGIDQNVVLVSSHVNIVKQTKYRYEELKEILSKRKFKQCLVFCNYQVRVSEVHKMLNKDKWPADKLYGQQDQTNRLEALKELQKYQCRLLVSTDLAARGIDASNVDLVVNFEVPYDWQTYLHRIGRAGRFGSYGSAVTILCKGEEEKKFKKLLTSINIPFQLKNFWSKKPYELDVIKKGAEISPKDESQPKIKKLEKKLGAKETYDELWKALSADSTEVKTETLDIPTFEGLCKSFEQANTDSNSDSIEIFTDLLTSFQNHEIKSSQDTPYKLVEVNKLIKPCTIFNHNISLQSFKKDKSRTTLEDNNNDECNTNGTNKLNNGNESASENAHSDDCDGKSKENIIQIKPKQKYYKSKNNGKARDYKSEHHDDFAIASESHKSQSLNSTKSEKYSDESDYISQQSDDNAAKIASPGHNDDEKSLLASNLPTAFGKSRQRYVESKQNRAAASNKQYKRSIDHQDNPRTKFNKQRVVSESSDEDEPVKLSYTRVMKPSKIHSCHAKTTKKLEKNHQDFNSKNNHSYNVYHSNTIIEERQREFDFWYQQLKTQMLVIEKSVYIAEMSNNY